MASACLKIWVENIKKSCSLYITKACHAFKGASQSCEEYNEGISVSMVYFTVLNTGYI